MSLKDYIRILKRHFWWIFGWGLLIFFGYLFYEQNLKSIRYVASAKFSLPHMQTSSSGQRPKNGAVKTADTSGDILIYGDQPDLRIHKTRMYGNPVMIVALRKYFEIRAKHQDERMMDHPAWFQNPYPTFVSDNPTEIANIKAFSACINISENYRDQSFVIQAHSTNRHKVNWMIKSFLDAYEEHEAERMQKSTKDVLDKNIKRYEDHQKDFEDIDRDREMKKEQLFKQYGTNIAWEDGAERKYEERDSVLAKLSEVNKNLVTLSSEIQEFEVYEPDRWLIEDGEGHKIVELQNELYAKREGMQQELASLRVDFTDKHPKVVRKLAELNSLNEAFPRLAQAIIDRKVRSLSRELKNSTSLKSKMEEDLLRLNGEIEVILKQKRIFDDMDGRQGKFREDIARLEEHIDGLQDDLTRKKASMEIHRPAPKEGIQQTESPNMKYYILIFGVIVGFAFAYLLDYLDDTIKTPHDVEKFVGMRVIGTVPLLSRGEEKLLHRIALKSPISEMMNTLSMIIQSWMLKMKGQSLLIVSSKPSEGKSTFITNLAVAMCRGGEKVVLIDSDMRKPSLHRFFGVDNSVGLSNYLEDSFEDSVEESEEARIAKIVHHTEVEGLFLIPSGPIPSNPVGLLKSENIDRLLSHLKTYIGVILIDTPPLAMIDAGVLATKVSAVVTVMDAGKVTKKEALAGKHLIENVGGNGIGVVLNKVTLEGEEYYYYFEGYSYYYGNSRARKKKPV